MKAKIMSEKRNEKKEVGLIEAADNALKNRVDNSAYWSKLLDHSTRADAEIYREEKRDVFDADDDRLEERADKVARGVDPH